MPSGYTAQQKAAISQFVSFAGTDQKTGIKVRSHVKRGEMKWERRRG